MYIKEFVKFELSENVYYPLYLQQLFNIGYIAAFYSEGFRNLKRYKILNSLESLESFFQDGIVFDYDSGHITIDYTTNLVYFSQSYYDYRNKPTTLHIEELLTESKWVDLCKIGFFRYTTMTKDNFYYLIPTWDKIIDQLPPFALLYLDDKEWYDVLPFETQEAMEQFVADHTNETA